MLLEASKLVERHSAGAQVATRARNDSHLVGFIPQAFPPWRPTKGEHARHTPLSPVTFASLSSSILQYRTVLGRTGRSEIGKAERWTSNDERDSGIDGHAVGQSFNRGPDVSSLSAATT